MKISVDPAMTVAAILLTALFATLSHWQWQRGQEKRALQVQSDANAEEAPIGRWDLAEVMRDPAEARYRRVILRGSFLPERQLLLDNRIYQGRVGVEVVTPFEVADLDQLLLVNRGWVPWDDRRVLPNVSIDAEAREITGQIYLSEPGFRLGEMDIPGQGWPRVIQYFDYAALSERLEHPVMPFTVRLSDDGASEFVRDWPVVPFTPERHDAYAFQWGMLALSVIVVYLLLALRERPESISSSSSE